MNHTLRKAIINYIAVYPIVAGEMSHILLPTNLIILAAGLILSSGYARIDC